MANTTEEMKALLCQVELFCARTGLELNVAKTVVQEMDYATGADLRPHLTYEGRRVPCLPARKQGLQVPRLLRGPHLEL